MKLHKKNVLVTGASSGIGRAVALQLGQKGNRLIVTARRHELLNSLAQDITAAGGQCLSLPADALSARDAESVLPRIRNNSGRTSSLNSIQTGKTHRLDIAERMRIADFGT